ncbi:MAG: undecaprenyl-diphosphate phosphatase [Candidatus Eisenbacteria bacterium]|uniref:Undecaprenyl-diphosphatase n=1 Tax=Eiseniibacteriota bacterium TaxID=2212470 RepID=A0A7Y2E951_UNCEI|nr:undecaprenyl-diphosphate phosphatase [Candidatus Eisenbacteria bacterium]
MSLLESVILGLVQGLTEFLPVSSSGHLVLVGQFMDLERVGLGFEVWVHLATLVAVTVALHKDLVSMAKSVLPGATDRSEGLNLWKCVIIGTIPAAIFGILAKDTIESAFGSVKLVGVDLIITGFILLLSRFFPGGNKKLTVGRALLIGTAQALAIFPGISRSGSTLTAGLILGLRGVDATRFSFLLAFPAILGAAVLEFGSLKSLGETQPWILVGSFLAASISGYVAIRIVWKVMERGRLFAFAPYCFLIGLWVVFFVG